MTNVINIKETFKDDTISREAGERLRLLIIENLKTANNVTIDFHDTIIASTSFFDEGFAKLALTGWSSSDFHQKINIKNMNQKDHDVLVMICKNRKLLINIKPLIINPK